MSKKIKMEINELAEDVRNYFVYNSIPNKCQDGQVFLQKGFSFDEVISGKKIDIKDKNKKMTADEQSAKTFAIIPSMLIYIAGGYTPIVIVANNGQVTQFIKRLVFIQGILRDYLKSLNKYSKEELSLFSRYLYYNTENRYSKKDNSLAEAISGVNRKVIICAYHHVQLSRINNILDNNVNCKTYLVIDEVHKLGAYTHTGYFDEELETFSYHNPEKITRRDDEMILLKRRCSVRLEVSATIQTVLNNDRDFYSNNFIKLNHSHKYTGIEKTKWIEYEDVKEDDEDYGIRSCVDNIIMERYINPLFTRHDFRNDKVDKHPSIFVNRVEREIKRQNNFSESVINRNIEGITSITEQGEGIGITNVHYKNKNKLYVFGHYSIKMKNGEHFFPSKTKLTVGDILQFIAQEGVLHHKIVVINTHDMGCMGMSYCSHFDSPQNWHATDVILRVTKSISCEDLKQAAARAWGNHHDDIRPTIYYNKGSNAKEKVIQTYILQNKQINSIISDENVNVYEHLNSLKIFDNLVNKKYVKFGQIRGEIVKNPDGRKHKKILKENDETMKILEFMSSCTEIVDDEIKKSLKIVGDEEYDRLTLKMFPIWATKESKIANFMKELSPMKVYDTSEMRELCDTYGIKHIKQLTTINIGTNGFGTILDEFESYYRLHPCLVESFNLNFNYN